MVSVLRECIIEANDDPTLATDNITYHADREEGIHQGNCVATKTVSRSRIMSH